MACKNRKCKLHDKRPACSKCTTCIKMLPVMAKVKHCAVLKKAGCAGCTVKSKLARCKGCLRCKTVSVTKKATPTSNRRCALRKTPKCAKCKLNSKAAACKGCTVCRVVKPVNPVQAAQAARDAKVKAAKVKKVQ